MYKYVTPRKRVVKLTRRQQSLIDFMKSRIGEMIPVKDVAEAMREGGFYYIANNHIFQYIHRLRAIGYQFITTTETTIHNGKILTLRYYTYLGRSESLPERFKKHEAYHPRRSSS